MDFIMANPLPCAVAALAIIVLVVSVVVIVYRKVKKSKGGKVVDPSDFPYENLENKDSENIEQPKNSKAEMDWLKGDAVSLEQGVLDENISKGQDTQMKNQPKTTAKTAATPKEQVKTTVATTKVTAKKAVGKWIVKEKGENEFIAYLYANNGELMLTSEIYSSADGAKKGIATIKKNVKNATFQVYCDKNRHYYFKLKTSTNRFLCVGESYPNKTSCLNAVESVKRFADAEVVEDVEKDITVIKYEPTPMEELTVKSSYKGKWTIAKVDDMFMAQLFASNGELLLTSESYVLYASAKTAVSTIKTNGIAGNFIVDKDKKGRFYFKLRNNQKSTLCIGETYSNLSACQSAIDSVRRFLATAELVEGSAE